MQVSRLAPSNALIPSPWWHAVCHVQRSIPWSSCCVQDLRAVVIAHAALSAAFEHCLLWLCTWPQVSVADHRLCLAAFVTCSAAGMALGPLLAVPMARVPTLQMGPLTFNPITAGAWVMSIIWVLFLAVTIIFFQEPPVRYALNIHHLLTVSAGCLQSCTVSDHHSAPYGNLDAQLPSLSCQSYTSNACHSQCMSMCNVILRRFRLHVHQQRFICEGCIVT